ncbi:hypothetical protein ABZ922_39340, partial [Streptomyces shenzhenensis]|uniref:PspA-associated protein PspAB n=1 Tax=Streptomyces shenzhenensis TaxID=943815 RepID=UPI00348CA10F
HIAMKPDNTSSLRDTSARRQISYSPAIHRSLSADRVSAPRTLRRASAIESNGFPGLSERTSRGEVERRLALVYLYYKRGAFRPLCVQPGRHRRDNALELPLAAVLENHLRIEKAKTRRLPFRDTPGLTD